MDSPKTSPKEPPAAAKSKFSGLRVVYVLLCFLLLGLLALLFIPVHTSREIDWLSPAQVVEATKPGPLAKLKQMVKNRLAPLLGRFFGKRPNIEVSPSVYRIAQGTTLPAIRGASVSTNSERLSAWVLTPAELVSLRQEVKGNPGATLLFAPRIVTGNGQQARAGMGATIPATMRNSTNVGIEVGIDISLLPRIAGNSVKLVLAASSTELGGMDFTNGPLIKTNFIVGCRVMIPDGGALVVICPNADHANPTNYLMMFSPRLVDAKDNPIKH